MRNLAIGGLAGWLVSTAAWAAPTQLPGFPVTLRAPNFSNGITLADVDNSGHPSIVTVAGEGVVVVDGHGAVRPGFPVNFHDNALDQVTLMFQAPPTLCDLRGDGAEEIVLAASNQRVFAVDLQGKPVAGFPISLDGVVKGPMTCIASEAGKGHDLLAVTEQGSVLRIPGKAAPGKAIKPQQVASVGVGAESGVAVLDGAGPDALTYVIGGGDAALYRLRPSGSAVKSFTYKMTFRSTGVPALADVNDDGMLDIVVGSEDFKIHAVDQNGLVLPGFPVETGYRLYAGACVGDVDGDGRVDVVAGSGDGKVYAVDGKGLALPGFPAKVDGRITTGCVLADVDRDGRQEIVVTTQQGTLYVFDAKGSTLAEFPVHVGNKAEIAPAVGDLNGDGYPDIVAQARDGTLHAYTVAHADKVPQALVAWGMVGHDPGHTGRLRPHEGRFRDLTYEHPEPLTTDTLRAKYAFYNADGLKEGQAQIRWYLHGTLQADLNNKAEVPADRTQKHQLWQYTLQDARNFATYGEKSVLTHVFDAPKVEVLNTPPTAPSIVLSPNQPSTLVPLKVAVSKQSTDADGDALQYHTIWLTDGRVVRQPSDITTIVPDKTTKHEIWRAMVLAYDGEAEGPPALAEVEIQNTPPGTPRIALSPDEPRTDDRMTVRITEPAPDDDHDPVHYRYLFWVNGAPIDLPDDGNVVPPRTFHKHDAVRVRVTAWDDEVAGGAQETNITLRNTPPPPPKLAIWPPHPRTRDALVLGVEAQPEDADGDPVALRHQWYLNGAAVTKPAVVPHADTTRGQRWKLVVTPFDGEVEGQSVTAETLIENTPPTAPVLVLDHYEVFTDEAVVPKVLVPATDDDGDAIRIKYKWVRNDKPMAFPADKGTLDAADTRKGEVWSMTATPTDGDADGTPTQLTFKVINAPPGAPVLSLSSQEPTVEDTIAVQIAKPAPDKDNDKLVYRYRWLRDGVPVSMPLDQNALPPRTTHRGEHWRVEVRAFDGEAEGDVSVAELRVRNRAPTAPEVMIEPTSPLTRDALTCRIRKPSTDADGDTLTYRTRWFANDAPVVLAEDVTELPASLTFEKQVWRCEVQAFDGHETSTVARSKDVRIGNTPPSAPKVAIEPVAPHTDDDLQCALVDVAEDADFDPLTYKFTWWLESKPFTDVEKGQPQRVAAAKTRRGQNWECMATPHDGKVDGTPARAAVTIQNSLPTLPKVAITPDRPHPGDTLTCEIETPAHDADGDAVVYSYQWYKDGVVQPFAQTSSTVPGRLVTERDLWSCKATPHDDVGAGPTAVSQDVAVLAPPEAPKKRR